MKTRQNKPINLLLISATLLWCGFIGYQHHRYTADELREMYSKPASEWPTPLVDEGIAWKEIAPIPPSPYKDVDSLRPLVDLGKVLFFDPRLSSSEQISCSSCHDPQLSWSNGRTVAVGHDHQLGQRNTPSLFYTWAGESFFWDGRVASLEEQAKVPVENPLEMHQGLEDLPAKLDQIDGYHPYFEDAFGDGAITVDRIAAALAYFQRTLEGRTSDLDKFLKGDKDAMSDEALRGLHLFRTKARCMNCHSGPFLTDNKFHNLGLHYFGRKYEDLGRYQVTKDPEDVGKFKTPTLREVMRTGPWMHNGLFHSMEGIMNMYDHGMSRPKPRPEFKDDPLWPTTSEILKPLGLTQEEKHDLIAFLESMTTLIYRMPRPELPQ
ncbi:cytochrome-c peroxidase [Echinicola strongylocentroti]|uniref:Cytochrome-c peroxidase n=1 Tax=Echinicola strongylocentroti TaxID=1795355 RepID=A0A2Z4IHS3_9BACT|nr:cytochrome c peroxidase [Echinicola strongylocentroti]AWW30257.1 cytochrome-c peroxidase [Echinicola strongylocentroti]